MINKNYTNAWAYPIPKEEWKTFLSHTFTDPRRQFVYDYLDGYLKNVLVCLSLLELGFGQAYDFITYFKQHQDNHKISYVGYDITQQFVEYAQQEYPTYTFRLGNGITDNPDSVDIIYARHVLEHQMPENCYQYLTQILNKANKLVIISWFVSPGITENFKWVDQDGFNHVGAWVNRYDKYKISGIIEQSGYQFISNQLDEYVYILKRR